MDFDNLTEIFVSDNVQSTEVQFMLALTEEI